MKVKTFFLSIAAAALLSCTDNDAGKDVIASVEDMNGRTVSVLSGSVQDLLVSEVCPDSHILRSDTDTDALMMLETGKADAMLHSSISWNMAKSGYHNIVSIGEGIRPIPIGIGFRKDHARLRDNFNAFLSEYLKETDYETIVSEWTAEDSPRKMPHPEDHDCSNGHLHFAVSAIIPPFDFIRNNEISGVEAELMARFAIHEKMSWDFADVAFSGLIAYIQSGKADMGAAIMCITPERQQSIDFSNPTMYESSLLLVGRKHAPAELAGNDEEVRQSLWQSIKSSVEKSLIKEKRYMLLVRGLESTVVIALLAALFGTILGMFLCYTSMRRNRLVSRATAVYIEFMRCMPQVVLLMMMFYVVFGKSDIDALWVAVIAFTLCFGAYTSVIFRSAVESVDKGQTEAALSMGFGKVKAFWNVVLPQAVQRAMPVYKGEFISLVKATSIVGYIAVFDLTKAGDVIRSRTYEAFFPLILVTIIYFLVIWVLTILLKYLERRTQPTRKKFFK